MKKLDKQLAEQDIDRREALKKLGKCAAYAAPVLLSVMVLPKKTSTLLAY